MSPATRTRVPAAAAGAAILLVCAAIHPAGAQQPAATAAAAFVNGSASLTLAEAERLLLERNLSIVAARRGVDVARAQRIVAGSLPPSQISLGNTAGQVNEIGGRPTGWRLISPANNINLGLTTLIERGGKRKIRSRAANEQIGIAEAQVLDTLRGQLFQLRQAFLGALLARANLDVALVNRGSLDRTESLLRRQAREGQIPDGDLIRFQASRPSFEADAATAALNYAAAIAALAALLGADATVSVPMRGATAPLRIGTLAPTAVMPLGRLDTDVALGVTWAALTEATGHRPDVVAAARAATSAAANRELAEAAWSRDVTFGVDLSRTRLQQNLPGVAEANNQFSLSVSVPIFTARITSGNIGVAMGQQAQAEAQARHVLLQARADLATAWASWEQARALRAVYDGGALRRAEEAYAIAERAYLAGGRSLVEVLDALRTLNVTRLAANQARHAALLSLAALEQASGVTGLMPGL